MFRDVIAFSVHSAATAATTTAATTTTATRTLGGSAVVVRAVSCLDATALQLVLRCAERSRR